MKRLLLMTAFAVPMAFGWATASSVHDGVSPDQDHDKICEGGSEAPIDVSFEIMAVDRTKLGESLSVHAEVHNHFEGPVRAIAAHEVVDDRGRTVRPAEKVELGVLESGEGKSIALRTPHELKPGFYEMRLTAAGAEMKDNGDSIAIQSMFFSVGKDGVLPISHDDFLLQSNAGLAFVDTDVKETK